MNKSKIKISGQKKHIVRNAMIAKKHKLYVAGWTLKESLENIVEGYAPDSKVILAWDNDTPIGVLYYGLIEDQKEPNVSIFVRKAYRFNGIGSKLISSLKKKLPKDQELNSRPGVKGSYKFWKKNEVECNITGYDVY